MTAVGNVPDVPRTCAPAEKVSFCPQKERYWPQIGPIFDNYFKLVNYLTWPDHAPAFVAFALPDTPNARPLLDA
jgi:hypothetical protein